MNWIYIFVWQIILYTFADSTKKKITILSTRLHILKIEIIFQIYMFLFLSTLKIWNNVLRFLYFLLFDIEKPFIIDDQKALISFFQINLQANRPLLPLVRIRAYVGGSLCGLLLDRGRQYVISGRSWLLVLFCIYKI